MPAGSAAAAWWVAASRMSVVGFAQQVLRKIDADIDALATRMADGQPQDWTAYRAAVAERRGLLKARDLITERFSEEERSTFQLT